VRSFRREDKSKRALACNENRVSGEGALHAHWSAMEIGCASKVCNKRYRNHSIGHYTSFTRGDLGKMR